MYGRRSTHKKKVADTLNIYCVFQISQIFRTVISKNNSPLTFIQKRKNTRKTYSQIHSFQIYQKTAQSKFKVSLSVEVT